MTFLVVFLAMILVVGLMAPPPLFGAICVHLIRHPDLQDYLRTHPDRIPALSNDPRFLTGIVPAGNGVYGQVSRSVSFEIGDSVDIVLTQGNGEQINGYQVIQQISERSNGAWRPSPGSVYPTIQQLEDAFGLLRVEPAAVVGQLDARHRRQAHPS